MKRFQDLKNRDDIPYAELVAEVNDAADRVRKAVAAARAEVVTGKDDKLLRRADVSVDPPARSP